MPLIDSQSVRGSNLGLGLVLSKVKGGIYLWVDSIRTEWDSWIPYCHRELLGQEKRPHAVIGTGSSNSSQYETIKVKNVPLC